MKARVARGLIVVAFALVCGHFAWRTFGPPTTPDYCISDEQALVGTDSEARQVYLRRTLYLAERPRHAWLHVVATDSIEVYVNGRCLGSQANCGFPVAMAVDPAPELQRGTNVIAMVVRQTSVGGAPAAAVRGGYVLSDGEHSIGPDDPWRLQPYLATPRRLVVLARIRRSPVGPRWCGETTAHARRWPTRLARRRRRARPIGSRCRRSKDAPWRPAATLRSRRGPAARGCD